MSTTARLIKALTDAMPKGHNPHLEALSLRIDLVKELIDHLEWIEKGLAEWRDEAKTANRHAEAARATARVAITHLQSVMGANRTPATESSARDWLTSIGG